MVFPVRLLLRCNDFLDAFVNHLTFFSFLPFRSSLYIKCFRNWKCKLPFLPYEHNQELYGRDLLRAAKRISNPGCYATSSQLLIAPLVNYIKPGALPTVFGVSGYSGAGTVMEVDATGKPVTKPKVTAESLGGGIKPYALTGHIHEREAGHHLSSLLAGEGSVKVAFIPSVAPWFSGIISTVSIPLKEKMTAKDVIQLFEEKYQGEKLIKIQKDVVQLKDVEGKHGWSVGGFQMSVDGDRVVIVVSDLIFFFSCVA